MLQSRFLKTSMHFTILLFFNHVRLIFKPNFHMSGKYQTIGDFVVSRPFQIWPICRKNRRSSQKSGTRREIFASDFTDLF